MGKIKNSLKVTNFGTWKGTIKVKTSHKIGNPIHICQSRWLDNGINFPKEDYVKTYSTCQTACCHRLRKHKLRLWRGTPQSY